MSDAASRLYALGLSLIGGAAAFGLIAFRHMLTLATYGPICGLGPAHCPACPAAAVSLAAGVALLAASARASRREPVRLRA